MVTCKSLDDKFQCSIHKDGFEIIADATVEKGGQGQGFRPHDILEAAYASCLTIFVRMLCEKMRIPSDRVCVTVDLLRLESETIFNYNITFGSDISAEQQTRILKAVEECPVRKTLSKPIGFEFKPEVL